LESFALFKFFPFGEFIISTSIPGPFFLENIKLSLALISVY